MQKVFSGELSRPEAAEILQVTTQAVGYHVLQFKKIGPVVPNNSGRLASDLDSDVPALEASVGNLGGQQADSRPADDEPKKPINSTDYIQAGSSLKIHDLEPVYAYPNIDDSVHHSAVKNKGSPIENKTSAAAPSIYVMGLLVIGLWK